MSVHHLIEKFDQINPNTESLFEVDAIIDALSQYPDEATQATAPMLRIFERLEFGSYNSVLWSIVHAIEALPDYQDELIKSVYREPNEFNLLMINRNLNSGEKEYKSHNYLLILKEISAREKLRDDLKKNVEEYIEMHSVK